MAKTRKVQVTLEQNEYDALAKVARRNGKKLAAVVRESIRRYTLLPEGDRETREALKDLLNLPPTPAPGNYSDWEQEYGAAKGSTGQKEIR